MGYYSTFTVLMLFTLFLFPHAHCAANSPSNARCIESERKALMELKSSLSFDIDFNYKNLTSWKGRECCFWERITCHRTGFVRSLDLSDLNLGGHINSSILKLEHLEYLDLSFNGFQGLPIPAFLGSLKNLQFLKLSMTGFVGEIPPELGNLTNLQHLSLGGGESFGESYDQNSLSAKSLNWITRLYSLQSLKIRHMNLSECVGCLDSLCSLTRLTLIDLSYSKLQGWLPSCLANLTSLTQFYVEGNKMSGEIPGALGNLTQLTTLDLSNNQLTSSIPSDFGGLQKLIYLGLNDNQLNGTFPLTLGSLGNLQTLDVSRNFLIGELTEFSFEKVGNLQELIISRNPSLIFTASSQWIPPFQIKALEMDSFFVGPHFPTWLRTQKNLTFLDMSNANLSGPVPTSDVINNASLITLVLSGNKLSGNIPDEICNFGMLRTLSLAKNQLIGKIPSCLGNLQQLHVLDLANNRLSGHIPMELGSLVDLFSIHLNENKLSGELPASMQNLKWLATLDVGKNELQGCIPDWMGGNFSQLQYLRFESNNFSCGIPSNICQLSGLHILNLADNNLLGTIPPCLGNLSAMLEDRDYTTNTIFYYTYYIDTLLYTFKGTELEYSSVLPYSNFISLSGNHLQGEIPQELVNLIVLQSLNLSNNDLTGRIPERIGILKHLESLDLSMNQLSGTIPQSLANIDSLSYLNLSFNNLEGMIPSGNHFETVSNPFSYEGNGELCGKVLNRSCSSGDDSLQSRKENGAGSDDDNGELEWSWLFAGIGPGFGVGFLGVIFILCFNKAWRYAYFRFLDNVYKTVCGFLYKEDQ